MIITLWDSEYSDSKSRLDSGLALQALQNEDVEIHNKIAEDCE